MIVRTYNSWSSFIYDALCCQLKTTENEPGGISIHNSNINILTIEPNKLHVVFCNTVHRRWITVGSVLYVSA